MAGFFVFGSAGSRGTLLVLKNFHRSRFFLAGAFVKNGRKSLIGAAAEKGRRETGRGRKSYFKRILPPFRLRCADNLGRA